MTQGVPESDWKIFRKLRLVALDRLCGRILNEAQEVIRDESRSRHERYLELFRLIQDRDDDVARAFNGAARSAMTLQLYAMCSLDLINSDETARFSPQTRKHIDTLRRALQRK